MPLVSPRLVIHQITLARPPPQCQGPATAEMYVSLPQAAAAAASASGKEQVVALESRLMEAERLLAVEAAGKADAEASASDQVAPFETIANDHSDSVPVSELEPSAADDDSIGFPPSNAHFPEQGALARLVVQSLNVSPAVAMLVAKSMIETAKHSRP